MIRETYKGCKIVIKKGAQYGYANVRLNGVDKGDWMQSEEAALRSVHGSIDHAEEVGPGSARYPAEYYAPGSYDLCGEGHTTTAGAPCQHDWCVKGGEQR